MCVCVQIWDAGGMKVGQDMAVPKHVQLGCLAWWNNSIFWSAPISLCLCLSLSLSLTLLSFPLSLCRNVLILQQLVFSQTRRYRTVVWVRRLIETGTVSLCCCAE